MNVAGGAVDLEPATRFAAARRLHVTPVLANERTRRVEAARLAFVAAASDARLAPGENETDEEAERAAQKHGTSLL